MLACSNAQLAPCNYTLAGRCLSFLMTGMYGHAKMRDGERICNLSVFVVQRGNIVVETMKYDTENKILRVNHSSLNGIIWPGNGTRMPASDTAIFQCMYTHID